METEETSGLGYERVDEDPNVDVLLATMDSDQGDDPCPVSEVGCDRP